MYYTVKITDTYGLTFTIKNYGLNLKSLGHTLTKSELLKLRSPREGTKFIVHLI